MAGENVGKGLADGMTVGSSATEKVGFWGVTPVVQPAPAVAVGTDLATLILEVADLRAALVSSGVILS